MFQAHGIPSTYSPPIYIPRDVEEPKTLVSRQPQGNVRTIQQLLNKEAEERLLTKEAEKRLKNERRRTLFSHSAETRRKKFRAKTNALRPKNRSKRQFVLDLRIHGLDDLFHSVGLHRKFPEGSDLTGQPRLPRQHHRLPQR